jgi:hypothetical protein
MWKRRRRRSRRKLLMERKKFVRESGKGLYPVARHATSECTELPL